MARARNIKPGFFTNDLLSEINPLGRLLFAGIWTIADREGRLEDRPKKIKAEVLPFDSCNVDKLLDDLDRHKFILRYEVDGVRYIQVSAWKKHQNPHIKEGPSTIPAPVYSSAKPVIELVDTQPKPERAVLIPDSLNLIPDSQKAAAAATEPESTEKQENQPPPLSDSLKARAKILAERLSGLESKRLGRKFHVSAEPGPVAAWAVAGVDDSMFREAYDIALERRLKEGGDQPISPGFLHKLLVSMLADEGKTVAPIPVKAWHETPSGIEEKAKELGVPRVPGNNGLDPFPAFKARVFAAAGMQAQAA